RILILGFTFKENCPDTRNTKVVDIYHELRSFSNNIEIYDPWANPKEVYREYMIHILESSQTPDFYQYEAIILAVAHTKFSEYNICKSDKTVVFDVKGILPKEHISARL
ncbi:UDP binding domain-containing protein, partial [Pseudomonas aeruginosa]|uniref:UDP binding domain-containing protein n=1 Tax=Pseudomonas aeruginosa TaxID=287 RepID=UPI002B4076B6